MDLEQNTINVRNTNNSINVASSNKSIKVTEESNRISVNSRSINVQVRSSQTNINVRNVNNVVRVRQIAGSGVQEVVAGTNVSVDNTDPKRPIVSSSGGGGGAVDSVNGKIGHVVLNASDVGADIAGSALQALSDANSYTDQEISDINFPYYQYIYDPFETLGEPSGNRYSDWEAMITDIGGREAIIQFVSNGTNDTIVLPTGHWNIDYQIWRGNGQNPDGGAITVEFPEGCHITSAINWQCQNGFNLYSSSTTHPTYTMTVPHTLVFDRTAVFTDDIEFVKFTGAGLFAVSCLNGFGLYNTGAGGLAGGNYEVFNVDGPPYSAVLVLTKQQVGAVIQDNTARSTVPIIYGWLTQSSEANSGFPTMANLDAGSIDFTGAGGALFSNASVIGFTDGQPNGIPETNVADALAGLVSRGVTQVVHGSDNTVARPDYWLMVIWIGSVEPDNMAVNDLWINV